MEGSFKAAGSTTPVQGMRTSIYCDDESEPIELRLAGAKGKLTVSVAQDATSEASGNTVAFNLIVDGRTVQSKNVSFSKSDTLSTDLTGAVVVKIVARGAYSDGCGNVLPLITKLEITTP